MLDLNKYVNRGQTAADIVHTSGYAKIAAPNTFGASSDVSFEMRRSVDMNRRVVRGYNNSKIIGEALPIRSAQIATPDKAVTPPPIPRPMPIQLPGSK